MAFAAGSFSMSWMARLVGAMSNSTLRRSASRFTSSITGNRPYAPVPITSRWHFHGISFDGERRVPKLLMESLRRLLLAFANLPAVDDEVVLVGGFANAKRAKAEISEVHRGLHPVEKRFYALFFEVTAKNSAQRCSTLLLPQCGHLIFSFPCSAMVRIFEKVFWQAWQKK